MIGYLKGKIISAKPTKIILDVNGVGYLVNISISTFEKISDSQEISLFIHTHVREDALSLYGFYTEAEKEMFELLISISGIGPKVALSILSGISVDELQNAIQTENVSRLVSVPGVGRKTAERVVLELKSKVGFIETTVQKGIDYTVKQEAVLALTTLGYNQKVAEKIVRDLLNENPTLSLEDLIRKSLSELNK
ncbi:Holliday junction resolvasome DNA-binding subunit [Ignavibacterium album JCM 16511]|uniref:Holliday junction branch migration complex subunit RuvA n=1 Tax=Ignavibacterium album (strain DSM 19864 / JCM 16511 / NBRC 101810 / Mat9-16) TaxID=945713 RepID=I0AGC0_IGNAJ|nr:Holliday junction branch migration protein RuvA [Ignavibacterium album]AFH48027.1 Holliday junction resolvasome DNA-binding subunit [Ignavibacterium album JCM 16511]